MDRACAAAEDAFWSYGYSTRETRADFLDAIANEIEARAEAITEIGSQETGLPAANVLIYTLENGATVVVRPSGTEPKIKTYFTTLGKTLEEAQAQKDALAAAIEPILK